MYFSVKSSVKIAGKVYVPCICYALPDVLAPTVKKMVEEGKAYIYEHKVAFQNGMVLTKKSVTEAKTDKKSSKKSKKEEKIETEELKNETEENITTDESEGF